MLQLFIHKIVLQIILLVNTLLLICDESYYMSTISVNCKYFDERVNWKQKIT